MAFVYHALFHVVNENEGKVLVNESNWGEHRLTGDDLVQYQADMEEAFAPLLNDISTGKIVISDITEEITTSSGQTVTIKIGDKLTFPGATSKYEFHSKFTDWSILMKQDANTLYSEPIWVDATA